MNSIIISLLASFAFMFSANRATNSHSNLDQNGPFHLHQTFKKKKVGHKDDLAFHPENVLTLAFIQPEPDNWNLNVKGFSPAYYDKVREAIGINTVEQPTDQWAAATTSFEHPSGVYTIRFTSLLESDGECSYILRIGGKNVLGFQNPSIYGEDIEEYAPHEEEVKHVTIEAGSLIQVEFLPHSNGLVPEGDGFGFARARWKSTVEFIPEMED